MSVFNQFLIKILKTTVQTEELKNSFVKDFTYFRLALSCHEGMEEKINNL